MGVQYEMQDCITFAGYMNVLGPRYGIVWTHIPSGGKRHIKTAVAMRDMGLRKGVFDYYFRKQGLPTLWIEFKHGSNKITPEQEAWRNLLAPMGDDFEVVYNPIEALARLTARGFLPEGAYRAVGPSISIPWQPGRFAGR